MNSNISKSDLVALLSGDVTAQSLAERHGVSIEEVEGWKKAFLLGLAAGAEAPVVRRPMKHRALVAAAAVLATAAFAQLTVFQANSPANAAEVNGNFTQLKTWIENKVGVTSSNDVSIAAANKVSFGSTTRQMIDLWGTSYGLGVQNSTGYFRSADTFAWYRGGTHSNTQFDPGAGGAELMRLSPSMLRVGSRFMMGSPEARTMVVRGTVTPIGATSITTSGAGFSVTRANGGAYDVTFDTPFLNTPTVLCSPNHPNNSVVTGGVVHCTVSNPGQISSSTFRVFVVAGDNSPQDWPFSFIAVGQAN